MTTSRAVAKSCETNGFRVLEGRTSGGVATASPFRPRRRERASVPGRTTRGTPVPAASALPAAPASPSRPRRQPAFPHVVPLDRSLDAVARTFGRRATWAALGGETPPVPDTARNGLTRVGDHSGDHRPLDRLQRQLGRSRRHCSGLRQLRRHLCWRSADPGGLFRRRCGQQCGAARGRSQGVEGDGTRAPRRLPAGLLVLRHGAPAPARDPRAIRSRRGRSRRHPRFRRRRRRRQFSDFEPSPHRRDRGRTGRRRRLLRGSAGRLRPLREYRFRARTALPDRFLRRPGPRALRGRVASSKAWCAA